MKIMRLTIQKNEELKKCDGSVKIQNVNFSYEPEFKLIEGLNLDVKGEKRLQ